MDLEGQAPSTLSSRACGARSSGDDEKRLQPVRLCVAVSLLDSFDDSSNHIKLPEKNISGAFMGHHSFSTFDEKCHRRNIPKNGVGR